MVIELSVLRCGVFAFAVLLSVFERLFNRLFERLFNRLFESRSSHVFESLNESLTKLLERTNTPSYT